MARLESLLISTCLERENRDGVIKNYLKDGPQKPSYSFNDVTYNSTAQDDAEGHRLRMEMCISK
jgi:hypothetical protein